MMMSLSGRACTTHRRFSERRQAGGEHLRCRGRLEVRPPSCRGCFPWLRQDFNNMQDASSSQGFPLSLRLRFFLRTTIWHPGTLLTASGLSVRISYLPYTKHNAVVLSCIACAHGRLKSKQASKHASSLSKRTGFASRRPKTPCGAL